MRRATLSLLVVLVSAAATEAQEPEKGKTTFTTHCESCHGPDASGGQGPPLVPFHASLSEFTAIVRQGVGLMPAFPRSKISDEQIAELHAYLSSLNKGVEARRRVNMSAERTLLGRGATDVAPRSDCKSR